MGVAFLAFHVYYNPGHPNHGKLCIVLGQEKAGSYAGFFNFIGGSSHGHGNEMNALKGEVSEELGLVLNQEDLSQSLIDRVKVKGTAFYGCAISGLSERKWNQMMNLRGKNIDWKYQELATIRHFPIDELANSPHISTYVRQFLPLIYTFAKKFDSSRMVHYSQFVRNAGYSNVQMLQ
jgi:8-oxo-dGTP pyrophosphatase MutT (NUDIX family)